MGKQPKKQVYDGTVPGKDPGVLVWPDMQDKKVSVAGEDLRMYAKATFDLETGLDEDGLDDDQVTFEEVLAGGIEQMMHILGKNKPTNLQIWLAGSETNSGYARYDSDQE